MKKFLLATTAALLAAPALAADLPRRSAPVAPAPVYAAPIFTWAGFYVGAQVGYAWGTTTGSFTDADGTETDSFKPKGFIGGLHAGYNWQRGALVYGLEADIEAARVRKKVTEDGETVSFGNDFRGSARVRMGYAFDRALLYVTGGLALGQWTLKVTDADGSASISKTGTGWTLGAGLQYALTDNWSARAEYRYTQFGKVNLISLPEERQSAESKDHAVRVGVSYRFGGASRPVVARY